MIGHSLGNLGLSSASLRTSLDNWAYNTYIESGTQGIVYNTHEEMWLDMNDYSTGYPSNMPSNYPQFIGGVYKALDSKNINSANIWFEIEAGNSGPTDTCGLDANASTNTMVEIGIVRMWERRNGVWNLRREIQNTRDNGTGWITPNPNQLGFSRPCGLDEAYLDPQYPHLQYMYDNELRTNLANRLEWRPDYYYRYHGWAGRTYLDPVSEVDGVCGTIYMRLVLKDPDGVDDRASSHFVAHCGCDVRLDGVYAGDMGIGRYKKLTNEWQPLNFYTFNANITPTSLQQLIVLDPPLAEPDTLIPQSELTLNSYERIWDSMYGSNSGWVSNMPSSYAQFQGPVLHDLDTTTFDAINIWFEVEEAGDGSSCSTRINTSTNTMVEIGTIRMWERRNGVWTMLRETPNTISSGTSTWYPNAGTNLFTRPCGLDELNLNPPLPNYSLMTSEYGVRTNADGFVEARPDFYYRRHGWCPRITLVPPVGNVECIMGTVYMRLVLKDPNGIDDRATSNFVAHVGGDRSLNGTYVGGTGVSRYYRITEKWTPINMFTFNAIIDPSTIEELIALDPPVALEP